MAARITKQVRIYLGLSAQSVGILVLLRQHTSATVYRLLQLLLAVSRSLLRHILERWALRGLCDRNPIASCRGMLHARTLLARGE